MVEERIYFDYAAATPMDPNVVEAMRPFQSEVFANPSSIHSFGLEARRAVERSRQTIAGFLNADAEEICFTSSGTESNNLAIIGVAKANKHRGRHLITSLIEHPSVLNAYRILEKDGFEVTYLKPDKKGIIRPITLKKAITEETILISIHLANSEIGVIQPIKELAKVGRSRNVYFHTDACQATAFLDLNVSELAVDLLTLNGSKCYGPKGIAVLYVASSVEIFPIHYGGGQEHGLRSGTENVPGIVGLAKAIEIIEHRREEDSAKLKILRNDLEKKLLESGAKVNFVDSPRLPNHLSVILPISETNVVAALDKKGIAVSAGSACASRSLAESHVLTAIGFDASAAAKTVRISLGRQTSLADIDKFALAVRSI